MSSEHIEVKFKDPRWETPIHQGYMTKRGHMVKSWRKRFFILTDDGKLWYFKNNKSKNPKKKEPVIVKGKTFCPSSKKKFCLEIENEQQNFFFFSDTEESKEEWIKKLVCCGCIESTEVDFFEKKKQKQQQQQSRIPGVTYDDDESGGNNNQLQDGGGGGDGDGSCIGGRYYLFSKAVVLGDVNVGKSCILMRHIRNDYDDNQVSTVGATFLESQKYVNVEGSNFLVRFEIWDCAGQERYRGLAPMYYKEAGVVVIVYDITSPESLETAKNWVEQVNKDTLNTKEEVKIFLLGNKVDLIPPPIEQENIDPQQQLIIVNEEEVKHFCEGKKCGFLGHVSAKSGQGVEESFGMVREGYVRQKMKTDGIDFSGLKKGEINDLSEERKNLDDSKQFFVEEKIIISGGSPIKQEEEEEIKKEQQKVDEKEVDNSVVSQSNNNESEEIIKVEEVTQQEQEKQQQQQTVSDEFDGF